MASETSREKVLIVDDEPSVLHLLEFGLARLDCELCLTDGGEVALARAREISPSLVILDILMPDIDGYQVCRSLRQFSSTPVILLTALRDSADLSLALGAGADEYVAKPFSVADLLGRCRAALSRRRTLPLGCVAPPPFAGGRYTLDLERRLLFDLPRRRGALPIVVPLSNTAFRLVTYLACNKGRRLGYDEVLERVWGPAWTGESDLLDAHLAVVSRRLEPDPTRPQLIVHDGDGALVFRG